MCLSVGVSPANRDGVTAYVCGDLHRFAFEMYVSIVKCHNFISHMLNHGSSDSISLLHTPPVWKHVNDTYR